MATITFEGMEFEYDENSVRKYSVLKAMSNYQENPASVFKAFEIVFAGHDEEYAELLDDSIDKMSELFGAVMEQAGEEVKN